MSSLLRTLRLPDILLLFIGSVIGSGIFLTPGLILKQVHGSVGLATLAWIAGGVMSLLGAMTYAELAAANPEAGGLYCFIRDGFGRLPAFLYGWCLFLVISSATIAALARAFARYLGEVIPLNPWQGNAAALLMIAVVTTVNVRGTRHSSDLQNSTTLIKGGLVVVLSLVLLVLGKHGSEIPAATGAGLRGVELFSSFSLAMIAVLWAYEGWQFGTYSAGEVLEPQKVFPRAFLLGSLILIGLYVVAVLGYLVALGPARASESEAIAATAVGAVLGPRAGKVVALTILISVFSATNSVVLTAPRVFYAMAKDNLFFKTLAEVHPRFHTPAAAIIVLCVWSTALTFAGKFSELIEGVVFIGWIFYGLSGAAIFPLRAKLRREGRPEKALPYRVPGYPWTPILFLIAAAAVVGNAIFLATKDPNQFRHVLAALILMLLGVPAYFFWRWKNQQVAEADQSAQ